MWPLTHEVDLHLPEHLPCSSGVCVLSLCFDSKDACRATECPCGEREVIETGACDVWLVRRCGEMPVADRNGGLSWEIGFFDGGWSAVEQERDCGCVSVTPAVKHGLTGSFARVPGAGECVATNTRAWYTSAS